MANFPTLSRKPSYPLQESREDNTIRSDFEGGYQQTRPRFTRLRRKFTVTYKMLTGTDKSTLDTFLDTVRGGADSFVWTHPQTSTTYTVRFEKPPVFECVEGDWYNTSFTLEEV